MTGSRNLHLTTAAAEHRIADLTEVLELIDMDINQKEEERDALHSDPHFYTERVTTNSLRIVGYLAERREVARELCFARSALEALSKDGRRRYRKRM